MSNFWEYTRVSTERGPRCVEVPYVLNNIKDGSILEIGGNNSLFKWALVRRGVTYTLIDPLGTGFHGHQNLEKVKCLRGDIRDKTKEELGRYDNVLLVSVLEHISLPAYGQQKDWQKDGSPREAQRKAFRHCMSFVKDKGRMICTLPFGPAPIEDRDKKFENPNFLIRYNREMLNDLYKGYKLVNESIYVLTKPTKLGRWKRVREREAQGHRANVCFILEKK